MIDRQRTELTVLRSRPALSEPRSLLRARTDEMDDLTARARRCLANRLDRAQDDVRHQRARVRALSPLATLERGYALVATTDATLVTDPAQAVVGTTLDIRVARGRLRADVTETTAELQPTTATPKPTTATPTPNEEGAHR